MSIEYLQNSNIRQLLDKVSENIIIANTNYEIVWLNHSAKELLKTLGPHAKIDHPDDFIGQSLNRFYRPKEQILKNGLFPHSECITLFKTYTANIIVDQLKDDSNELVGYILTWKDITEFENTIQETRKQIQDLDTPIIPLALDTTILIPVLGKLTVERLHFMEEKVLSYCTKHEIEFILFDFSGVADDLNSEIAYRLKQIQQALVLMGVEPIYIGIRPEMARSIVNDKLSMLGQTCQSFKQGIYYVWEKTGHKIVKV